MDDERCSRWISFRQEMPHDGSATIQSIVKTVALQKMWVGECPVDQHDEEKAPPQ